MATDPQTHSASNPPTNSRLATIRGLLAKAEATEFAAEAEAFTAKASELMARYSLDEAMVWADAERTGAPSDQPSEVRIAVYRPFVAQKAVLVAGVAGVYRCQAIRLGKDLVSEGELVSVIGFPTDIELVETLVTSLFLQLTSAMTTNPQAFQRQRSAAETAAWRRSFISGFTKSVLDRLQADRDRATAAADAARSSNDRGAHGNHTASDQSATGPVLSAALVLADRSAAVQQEFRQRYPNVRTSRVSMGNSDSGHRAGTSAGNRADIGSRRLQGRPALGRG